MREYMLIIRNRGDHPEKSLPEKNQEFLKKCEIYIRDLKNAGKLISAQPLERQGKIISGSKGIWSDAPYNEPGEILVGYYHIFADDIDDAIAIAKRNPEFEYGTNARVEVRPIKTKEVSTGYVYPAQVK